jgi:hypothetical protein
VPSWRFDVLVAPSEIVRHEEKTYGGSETLNSARVPFHFTLIDKRHRAFVEGQSDTLLSLLQLNASNSMVRLLSLLSIGLVFLYLGGKDLVHDALTPWERTEAVITNTAIAQSSNSFTTWYFYEFETPNGQRGDGKIVGGQFVIGQRVPVLYSRRDPDENRYADDPLPKSVLDWFFIVMSVVFFAIVGRRARKTWLDHGTIRDFSYSGHAVPGIIIDTQQSSTFRRDFSYDVGYEYVTADGRHALGRQLVSMLSLTSKEALRPGTPVAIWTSESTSQTYLL